MKNSHLTLENRALQKEMESLKVALEAKEETIRAKQEVIDALRGEKHLKHNCYIYNPTHDHRAIN